MALNCFKAYDIRGRLFGELNEGLAERIGRAYAEVVGAGSIVVGYDVRQSSPALASALSAGLMRSGCDVLDIGLCGTEEVYFQTFHRKAKGGIMVTASHNPIDYNGMKLVREGARPVSGDSGLRDIERLVESGEFARGVAPVVGSMCSDADKTAYIKHLLSYVDVAALKPLKIVVNAGNGGAGLVIDALRPHLPFKFICLNHEPDGSFPNGIPNPLLPENRESTAKAVRAAGADFGLAWDGDFDRCFFFDSEGQFIEGYYLVGLLASQLLEKEPGAKIIHDPRLIWNTVAMVTQEVGVAIESKTGHAFIKERMRAEDAIYGGEMSAHHYFRNFAYCDSGMIPWLLIAERICRTGVSLRDMLAQRIRAFPCSGEINFRVADAQSVVRQVRENYESKASAVSFIDGISMEFADWRFNLRSSNTEPLLRLNLESRGDESLMRQMTSEISRLITGHGK
jgi:phosphomannomutase / phosphoglucomutase